MKNIITIPNYEIGEVNGFGLCISSGNTLIFTNLEGVESAKILLIDKIIDDLNLDKSTVIALNEDCAVS